MENPVPQVQVTRAPSSCILLTWFERLDRAMISWSHWLSADLDVMPCQNQLNKDNRDFVSYLAHYGLCKKKNISKPEEWRKMNIIWTCVFLYKAGPFSESYIVSIYGLVRKKSISCFITFFVYRKFDVIIRNDPIIRGNMLLYMTIFFVHACDIIVMWWHL